MRPEPFSGIDNAKMQTLAKEKVIKYLNSLSEMVSKENYSGAIDQAALLIVAANAVLEV